MTTKTAKARNPDRRNGKAWGKSHDVSVKALTPEAQKRKAQKDTRRSQVVTHGGGSSITLPRITWEWAEATLTSRWPNTRKVRTVSAWMAQSKGSDDPFSTVESNPEIKLLKRSRKNGR